MKLKIRKSDYGSAKYGNYKVENLFLIVLMLLESDLVDPKEEARARKVLATLREKGCSFQSPDIEDEDCLACLQLALLSALDSINDLRSGPLSSQ